MTARIWFICGGLLCVAAVVWHFAVSPLWLTRIPPGWSWKTEFIGVSTFVNQDGSYPDAVSSVYERTFLPHTQADRAGVIQLELRYTVRDLDSGKVTWESSKSTAVDAWSGKFAGADHRDDIALFPRHTEKKDYRLRVSFWKGMPMSFAGEEEIAGLTTYLFRYKGRIEYSEAYQATEDYQGIKVEPGYEIRCGDDQYINNFWVEPTTGEIVKWEDSCFSGDAMYEIATGKKLYEIARWGGVNRGDEILRRAHALRWQRLELLAITRYLPGLLLLIGAVTLIAGFVKHRALQHRGAEV